MTNEMIKKIDEVQDFWGNQMPMMAMEEAGEFIQAVSKMERNRTPETRENLVKEIRDMYISLKAIEIRYRINEQEIEDAICHKLNRNYEKKIVVS